MCLKMRYNGHIMEKLNIPVLKPRNPLVAASHFRKAGAHGTRRDRIEKALRREERRNAQSV